MHECARVAHARQFQAVPHARVSGHGRRGARSNARGPVPRRKPRMPRAAGSDRGFALELAQALIRVARLAPHSERAEARQCLLSWREHRSRVRRLIEPAHSLSRPEGRSSPDRALAWRAARRGPASSPSPRRPPSVDGRPSGMSSAVSCQLAQLAVYSCWDAGRFSFRQWRSGSSLLLKWWQVRAIPADNPPMAARPTWKGSSRSSLVNIPVRVFPATDSAATISFNQLHGECQTRIQQKRWCPKCEREIPISEVAKGFESKRGATWSWTTRICRRFGPSRRA